jgi:hypothetical protein
MQKGAAPTALPFMVSLPSATMLVAAPFQGMKLLAQIVALALTHQERQRGFSETVLFGWG